MIRATDFFDEAAYWDAIYEEAMGSPTLAESDRAEAYALGVDSPDQCWILSDRDVWYRNPAYHGPVQRHPED